MATFGWRKIARSVDVGLLTVTVVLLVVGLAALYSFTLNDDASTANILWKQAAFILIGLVVAAASMRFDYRSLGGMHWLLYGVGILLLIAVKIFGQTVHGTTGWFSVAGLQVQPVEFIKVIMAVALAKFFIDHHTQLNYWRVIFWSGLMVALPVGLILLQPDFGSASILVIMWLVLLMVLPIPRRYLATVLGVGLIGGVIVWTFLLQPYQQERLQNFLNPNLDPLGSGYNVRQAMTAVGSGQWFGRGLGLGPQSQLNFLPERQTDFIFATINEELGFVGGFLILGLFGLFFWRIWRMVAQVRDDFSLLFGIGLAAMFFAQVFINIGMNLGLFPVTGIPLPFLSYGGSSLLASLLAVGLLESMVMRQRPTP